MALEKWEIDSSHSRIHFSVRHLVVAKVRGQFARWSGSFVAEDGDLSRAKLEVANDASCIESGVADRDTHLKSPDFFDVASFPEITFKSTRIEQRSDEALRVTGDLTIRGVTREVAAVLHFDEAMLDTLRAQGINTAFLTLHVGAGTYRPMRVEKIADHRMHSERFEIPQATAEAIAATRLPAAGSSPSAPPACGRWNRRGTMTVRCALAAPRLISSSPPATASRSSTA